MTTPYTQVRRLFVNNKWLTPEMVYAQPTHPEACKGAALAGLYTFLQRWWSESPTMTVQTSGSTGVPKSLEVEKKRMWDGAALACDVLRLRPESVGLLCMDLKYIGAMMVVVRALCSGMQLWCVPPSAHPLAEVQERITFAAMVPLQVQATLSVAEETRRLRELHTLIIGGSALLPELEDALRDFPGQVYSTYGMTETLSHIALRQINGVKVTDCYYPLPGVSLHTDARSCLVIEAPAVSAMPVVTNDVVSLRPDGGFVVLGRADNVINSGGVKIFPEEIEKQLSIHLNIECVFTSVPHARFGEALVLLHPKGEQPDVKRLRSLLPAYHCPKYLFAVDELPHTPNGKVDRAEARRLAAACAKSEETAL